MVKAGDTVPMKRGKFIVIDGLDGSGKTTEMRLLKKEARLKGALFTCEPGGTPRAEKIRTALLTHEAGKRDPVSDFFLFWAARAAHMREAIAPALAKGKTVITDRFDSSTYAFQVVAEERKDLDGIFWACRKAVLGVNVPDAYIILDMAPEDALARRKRDRSKAMTSFDKQKMAYHRRVRAGFKKFKPGTKIYFIDSSESPEITHAKVWYVVKKILG